MATSQDRLALQRETVKRARSRGRQKRDGNITSRDGQEMELEIP